MSIAKIYAKKEEIRVYKEITRKTLERIEKELEQLESEEKNKH